MGLDLDRIDATDDSQRSAIREELNIPEYTVGDYYTRDNKSLKNVN